MTGLDTDDELRRKRELHAEIGRSRRRLADQLGATRESARELFSWRACVARHPLWSLAGALGLGMAVTAGVRPGRLSKRLGGSLGRLVLQRLWAELQRTWNSKPRQ